MSIDEQSLRKLIEESGMVSIAELSAASKVADHIGCSVSEVLTGRDLLSLDGLGTLLSKHYGVDFADLTKIEIPKDILEILPEEIAVSRNVIPFAVSEGQLYLAMEDPGDLETSEYIKKSVGNKFRIKPFVSTSTGIRNSLKIYQDKKTTSVQNTNEDISVIATIEKLLDDAIRQDASDIHIEAQEDKVLVRYRIDGVLLDHAQYNSSAHDPLVARIKILSDLKLDETRLPQDGQFSHTTKSGDTRSLRVSVIPTVHGEKVVLRILDNTQTRFNLEDLGLLPEDQELIQKTLEKSYGMFLVTGPTGSGKTTTLYTILGLLNKPETNIITIEDPVENKLNRVNQIQVNSKINLTFASGLRSMLRQDPDIIMVGEIRDKETAVIATNSAMTGHLVFSTVHANTSAGAVPRMIDLGVEPFLVASTLNMVVAQRLVRVLCHKCKSPTPITPIIERRLSVVRSDLSEDILAKVNTNYSAPGCDYCYQTGFRGRIGIFELLIINDSIKEMIVNKTSSNEIWNRAKALGTKSMIEDGLIKVSKGITSLDEVFRVVSD